MEYNARHTNGKNGKGIHGSLLPLDVEAWIKMENADKSKQELIRELEALRHHTTELEADQATLKLTVEALRGSEKQFWDLLAGSIQGIIILRDDTPLFVNQAYADMYGYETPEDILQMDSILPLIAPHEQDRLAQYYDIRLQGGDAPTHYEHQAIRKDGTSFWVENTASRIMWDGAPATMSTIVDITERKQSEAQLAKVQTQLVDAIESLTAAFVYYDADDRLVPSFRIGLHSTTISVYKEEMPRPITNTKRSGKTGPLSGWKIPHLVLCGMVHQRP